MKNKGWLRVLLASGLGAAAAALFAPALAPVAFIALLIALSPLARARRLWFVGDVESEYAIVSRRREEALRSLRDLEDDHLAGKISGAEFARQRPGLLQAAKEVTTDLDRIAQKRAAARKRIEEHLAGSGKA
ncbi:MAG: hypothetical protein IPP14_15385 [Planctomycetes bacterium]|nr:hypothetical protein [Planctomycetota bacterium]